MKKWSTSLQTSLLEKWFGAEDRVKCFLCTRRLRPMKWESWWRKYVFFWMPTQYEVGFVRPLEGEPGSATVFNITVCHECGVWAHANPLAGETLANARLESVRKHGEE